MIKFKEFLRTRRGRSLAGCVVGFLAMVSAILLCITLFGDQDNTSRITKPDIDTAITATDGVDWVQECAYRQAMLIDRIDGLLSCLILFLCFGVCALLFYTVLDIVVDFGDKRKNS